FLFALSRRISLLIVQSRGSRGFPLLGSLLDLAGLSRRFRQLFLLSRCGQAKQRLLQQLFSIMVEDHITEAREREHTIDNAIMALRHWNAFNYFSRKSRLP